jgi:hypothetical protein
MEHLLKTNSVIGTSNDDRHDGEDKFGHDNLGLTFGNDNGFRE